MEDEGSYPTLPESPIVYFSLMRTGEGKPVGMPIWSSFDNRANERSMENETFSSTFLSLAKNVADMSEDLEGDGKNIRISINQKSYNIFLPHPNAPFQLCFVIVFEEQDYILVEDRYKTELVQIVRQRLEELEELHAFLLGTDEQIDYGAPLGGQILNEVTKVIQKWDKKRVKYLRDKREQEEELRTAEIAEAEEGEKITDTETEITED